MYSGKLPGAVLGWVLVWQWNKYLAQSKVTGIENNYLWISLLITSEAAGYNKQ